MSLILFFLFPCMLWATDESRLEAIKENIKPVGEVYIEDARTHEKEDLGKETYEKYCSVCHRDGIAGAPRFQEQKDWDTRLSQKKLEDLLASALKGLNAMPAKGTCYECSETDIKNAIQYMLPKS